VWDTLGDVLTLVLLWVVFGALFGAILGAIQVTFPWALWAVTLAAISGAVVARVYYYLGTIHGGITPVIGAATYVALCGLFVLWLMWFVYGAVTMLHLALKGELARALMAEALYNTLAGARSGAVTGALLGPVPGVLVGVARARE
jgi:hypothetical protein